MPEAIRYLPHAAIDKEAWDRCISGSPNEMIYAYSFYLDHMAPGWDGLVSGDYEQVMPLPWRKKWGIQYLFQPAFCAQLGLFGRDIDAGRLEAFLDAIPKKFRYWDLALNHGNLFTVQYPLRERINYVLPLRQSYDQLWKAYRDNIRRNAKKFAQYGSRTATAVPVSEVIGLARQFAPELPEEDYERFHRLFRFLQQRQQAKTYAVYGKQEELLASCVFFFSKSRAYYILVGNHPNGRTLGASHALIDAFIKDHAGQDLLLDFEGSDVRNLAFFYNSFGAKEEKYAALTWNRLPFYIRWMKK